MGRLTPITERQEEVLRMIYEFMQTNTFPPTRKEVGLMMGRTPNAGALAVNILKRKGYIEIRSGISRGIVMTKKGIKLCKKS